MRPKKVILCVDDNEQELSVLKFMLVTNGYRVLAATNGQDAIELFTENAVDLVLADFAMPQMSGDQLVLRLKTHASHVPMVHTRRSAEDERPDPWRRCPAGEENLLCRRNCWNA